MKEFRNAIKEKLTVCTELLSILIRSQRNDGSIGTQNDENLLTHHLLLTLNEWNSIHFKEMTLRAVEWFHKMGEIDKSNRDNKESDFDPFKLIALKSINSKRSEEYVNKKLKVLKSNHVRAAGYAILDLGFRDAKDIADVFPTLSAIDLLLKDNTEESIKIATKSIEWCKESIEKNLVYDNFSSILGYLVLLLTRFEAQTNSDKFKDWNEVILNRLLKLQKDGVWDDSAYQSCYIFYDLAYVFSVSKDERLIQPIINFLKIFDSEFFQKNKIFGQQFFLVTCSILRGFSYLFTNPQKNKINKYIINEAMYYSAEHFQIKRQIENQLADVQRIRNDFYQKKYIPINPKVFTEREFKAQKNNVFVIMPFGNKKHLISDEEIGTKYFDSKNFEKMYSMIIKPAIEQLDLTPIRADSSFSPGSLMNKIWSQINEASIIIAVLTHTNANVLYEVGISHTLGKPVIFYTENEQYVPSDLKGIEYVKHGEDFFGEEENEIEKIKVAIIETLKAYGTSEIV